MFSNDKSTKEDFLQQTKAARKERALEKDRNEAARIIQKSVRVWISRVQFTSQTL